MSLERKLEKEEPEKGVVRVSTIWVTMGICCSLRCCF